MQVIDAIPTKLRTKALPWEQIQIMPIGDIQLGSPGTDIKRLREHVQWGIDHGVFWVGMGDYTDFLSPSNRRYLKNSGLYDTANELIEKWHREHLEELKDILRPTKGKWIGLHEGHHYFEYGDGTTSDTELCRYLDAKFLGTCAATRIVFKNKYRNGVECWIWSHHGEGGGMSGVARLLKVAPGFPQMDIFIQGHNTQLEHKVLNNILFDEKGGELKQRD